MFLNSKNGYTLVEVLVAAMVVTLSLFSVVVLVRKGQDQMWLDLHRRTARAIVTTSLENPQFRPSNYSAIPATIAADSVVLDVKNLKPKGQRTYSITDDSIAGVVKYKKVVVKVRWIEKTGAPPDSVFMERLVPLIVDVPANIAPLASGILCSSIQGGNIDWNVVDGITGQHDVGEWASNAEMTPYIQLEWAKPHCIYKVVLWDRGCPADDTHGGTLEFSDGSSILVTGIPKDLLPKEVTFIGARKTVTWVKFTITSKTGVNPGLSEFQVWE